MHIMHASSPWRTRHIVYHFHNKASTIQNKIWWWFELGRSSEFRIRSLCFVASIGYTNYFIFTSWLHCFHRKISFLASSPKYFDFINRDIFNENILPAFMPKMASDNHEIVNMRYLWKIHKMWEYFQFYWLFDEIWKVALKLQRCIQYTFTVWTFSFRFDGCAVKPLNHVEYFESVKNRSHFSMKYQTHTEPWPLLCFELRNFHRRKMKCKYAT